MGKIFGISDLPVSTIMTPFEQVCVPKETAVVAKKTVNMFKNEEDKFVSQTVKKATGVRKIITKIVKKADK